MSQCCASPGGSQGPKKRCCPVDGHECLEVSVRTIVHHLKAAWRWQPTATRYFFCDDLDCEVVYFGDDGSTILKSQMRIAGVKDAGDDALLCYCFGVSRRDFREDAATKDFVLAQTKAGVCACEARNPSGRCCLKDFPAPGE